ncbi:putative ferric-chelate reductase 1 [Haliotis cracherodii]|uniref:putative ferric-chelate reductase 1 n=1 Tax=Haliotis cracherodii TaxID=6455 RepID=UPI0039E844EE
MLRVAVLVAACAVALAYNPILDTTTCCSCQTLLPNNVPDNVEPQRMPSPFKIIVSRNYYAPLEEIKVNLTAEGDTYFRSFMIVAWATDYRSDNQLRKAVGKWDAVDGTPVAKDCLNNQEDGEALRSTTMDAKRMVKLAWRSPERYGHLEFRATFVVDDDTYWAKEKSQMIVDPKADPPTTKAPLPQIIDPINSAGCGKQKGCYRYPHGCWELYCEYIATWEDHGTHITFEVGAHTDGLDDRWVSLALSNDTYMGDDMVMDCVHNSENHQTKVSLSYNEPGKKQNRNLPEYLTNKALVFQEGSHFNGRIRCRFQIRKYNKDSTGRVVALTGNKWHIILARGNAVQGNKLRHGLLEHQLPVVSPYKVSLQTIPDVHDRARYPLVKAHGCLMLFAFVFCSSIALLLTKYYKPMWPNKRFFEQRYWFVVHFNLMALAFLVVIIAIILIFVEAGGWSLTPDLPQRAHPILGIIIFICILINPIIALFRPSEDNKCRPVFNWFHWAFGTIANVLAIPNIFIGMDFGKAMIPWWATWIMVFWVIFHLIIEVTLEVHQCCTHKKNKERRKKYEAMKRDNPKNYIQEPEPAGRRFKRSLLWLHLTVTTIITIIMIIVIAVC